MRKLLLLIACIPFTFFYSQAQYYTTDSNYIKLVEEAYSYLKNQQFKECLASYEQAFNISKHSVLSRIRASMCAWEYNKSDSWKEHLIFAIHKDWGTSENILFESFFRYPEFEKYQDTELYSFAKDEILSRKKKYGININLTEELKIMLKDDQSLRKSSDLIKDANEKINLWQKIHELDSINLAKIERIFNKYGYPGKSMVGESLSSVGFLIIQHSNLNYQEKYFSLIEKAAYSNEIPKSNLALLIDRIKMYRGEKQVYGSQITDPDGDGKWEFHPIEDEFNVNNRRSEMGMSPLEEYAKHFGIDYKLPNKQ